MSEIAKFKIKLQLPSKHWQLLGSIWLQRRH